MPLLTVHNLHKTYRIGRVAVPVLRGVDLSVEQGEFVAILGSSGSGKSTLLHVLGGLDRPDNDPSPRVDFDGVNVVAMSDAAINHYRSSDIGFVFQFYHLLPELTVIENVLVGAMVRRGVRYLATAQASHARAAELLAAVGLSHRLAHRPAELSGGERQRVAIARALINQPRLLLADEPTGNLDRETGARVLEMLLDLRRSLGSTMIVVTHDQATAARADRVVRLADGAILAAQA